MWDAAPRIETRSITKAITFSEMTKKKVEFVTGKLSCQHEGYLFPVRLTVQRLWRKLSGFSSKNYKKPEMSRDYTA